MNTCRFRRGAFVAFLFLWCHRARGAEVAWAPEYRAFLEEERARESEKSAFELGVSGFAAFFVGTYGYHFDDRGTVTRTVYSLVQSGGVVVMGNALRAHLGRSLSLQIDGYLRDEAADDPRHLKLRYRLLEVHRKNAFASDASLLFTSAVLTALYAYSGLREKDEEVLRNVYYFLSFNSALLAGVKAFALWGPETNGPELSMGMDAAARPLLLARMKF